MFGLVLVSGCGGTAGGRAVPVNATAPPHAIQASVRFTLVVPKAPPRRLRRPAYVSTRTQSVKVSVNGGDAIVSDVVAGAPGCVTVSQGLSCPFEVPAPVGLDTFSVQLYGQVGAQGAVLSQARTSATIVAGAGNAIALTLNGVVAKVVLVLSEPAPTQGTVATIPLTVTMYDAAGAAIVGDPFAYPVTLTDSDATGATTLSTTTLASPADAANLSVTYNGAVLGGATFGASATGIDPANVTPAQLTPKAAPPTFVDWPTYAFDNRRDGFNPSSSAFTPASLAQVHLAWQQLNYNGDYNTSTQPVLAANVGSHAGLVFTGGSLGILYAWDALTGALVWKTSLGVEQYTCGSGVGSQVGIGGTVAYDAASRSVFVAGNANASPNGAAVNSVVKLDALTGAVLGSVNVAPSLLPAEFNVAHTAVTLGNGAVFIGTSSTCDVSAWRGRVAAVDPNMTGNARVFYTTYGVGGNYSGGGVWAWGGVSLDAAGAVYAGVGNADNTTGASGPPAPFQQTADEQAGYGDRIVQIAPDLSALLDSHDPGYTIFQNSDDLDLAGVPVLFTPLGCADTLAAVQGKAGELLVYDTRALHTGPVARFRTAPSTDEVGDIGNPTWSPSTGLLYVNVSSGTGGSIDPPGMIALKPSGCGFSTTVAVAWHTAFGPDSYRGTGGAQPRSAPTVTAGGVVLAGTPCTSDGNGGCAATIGATFGGAVWALDAANGTPLNAAKPILFTRDHIRMPPVVDGPWLFVQDATASLYGLTLDPAVKAIAAVRGAPLRRHPSWFQLRHHR